MGIASPEYAGVPSKLEGFELNILLTVAVNVKHSRGAQISGKWQTAFVYEPGSFESFLGPS
jgi:hypothetical protein